MADTRRLARLHHRHDEIAEEEHVSTYGEGGKGGGGGAMMLPGRGAGFMVRGVRAACLAGWC